MIKLLPVEIDQNEKDGEDSKTLMNYEAGTGRSFIHADSQVCSAV